MKRTLAHQLIFDPEILHQTNVIGAIEETFIANIGLHITSKFIYFIFQEKESFLQANRNSILCSTKYYICTMRDEIAAAVVFLTRVIKEVCRVGDFFSHNIFQVAN